DHQLREIEWPHQGTGLVTLGVDVLRELDPDQAALATELETEVVEVVHPERITGDLVSAFQVHPGGLTGPRPQGGHRPAVDEHYVIDGRHLAVENIRRDVDVGLRADPAQFSRLVEQDQTLASVP